MKRRIHWPMAAALALLFLVPMGLAFVPGWPNHGYGWMWWLLPLALFFLRPAHRRRLLWFAGGWALHVVAYPEPDLGFLGWVLLVPYLASRGCEDGASWWRAALLYGFFRALLGFGWLGEIHFAAWFGVCLLSGLAFAFVFEGLIRLGRAFPFALRVAAAWLVYEWFHSWFLRGFPWLFLSHTQYRYLPIIQAADIVGAFGISFCMAYAQAAAFARRRADIVGAGVLVTALLAYGLFTPSGTYTTERMPTVLLVQSDIPHNVKESPTTSVRELWGKLETLTAQGMEKHPESRLIVWPETMNPYGYLEDEPGRGSFLPMAASLVRRYGVPFVSGTNSFTSFARFEAMRGHNSAVLVREDGKVHGLYKKQRLVPMGEAFLPRYVLPDDTATALFAWLVANLGFPRTADLEFGQGYATLDAGPGLRCATLICFEGLYPDMAREALLHADADLLLHLSNNGWFGRSWMQRQSIASWVMRAVETRTPFLSCANGGVTCAVAPSGRLLGAVDKVMETGVLAVAVPARMEPPIFLRGGHWILPGALVLAFGGLAAQIRRRRRLTAAGAASGRPRE